MNELEDKIFLEGKTGNTKSQEVIYKHYHSKLMFYFNQDQDLVQDSLIKFFKYLPREQEEGYNYRRLMNIVRKQVLIDELRQKPLRPILTEDISIYEGNMLQEEKDFDHYAFLHDAIESELRDCEKLAVNEFYLKGKNSRQIAEEFNLNENTVRQNIHTAKKKLKNKLKK